ncbi:MAG: hypothetical protein Q8M16_00550 [Pirellulaceae bacterium]|nr:hypothetical protein [Pirellulaceae bacterium]
MLTVPRREFLTRISSGSLVAGLLAKLPSPANFLDGREAWRTKDVRFNDEIEPWVRVLEETPHEQIIGVMAQHVASGRIGYRQFLAALFLAGIRNVQPRPAVGFKFHAVLVVNSAHLASIDAPETEKWLPLLWAVDSFKRSQARDVEEGNWTMAAVDESRLPSPNGCLTEFRTAMDAWDEERADVATAALARVHTSDEIFELFAEYAARDFRSIGHKAIYLANSYRTLETIGWHHAEPVLRSLSYALLNHVGEPNPATSDLAPDRDGRGNWQLARQLRDDWMAGSPDEGATVELIECLRQGTATDASDLVFRQLQRGAATASIYNAMFVFASELTMRQPGIVPLHAVTTTNAMNYIFRKVRNPLTRAFVLLQNAAFLSHFLSEARQRGVLAERTVDQLVMGDNPANPQDLPQEIFSELGRDASAAAQQTYAYLQHGHPIYPLIRQARALIFLKGDDSHDYKYSSAVLEDYFNIGATWRDRYFSAALFKMRHAGEGTTGLIQRIQQALG